ncbi:MAG: 16S rRNA (guanine(527)-N(7))-methyltransferase RsmG [Bacteroidales bacterium]|nr:16S rRNA (guanine(527)-N(7))-methyltransferase RsmG [Lentimicrobiaceae bacterium]MDD5695354.1 16S rRNA (guanine(527)-N(7))-methyltransferase RsmG [Bacteroidales bacterium]
MTEIIQKYFPEIGERQKEQFARLYPLYLFWNMRINVISRRDMENLYIHHVLHSLSIARVVSFRESTRILDAGTGGGFPGIPLAILFPDVRFHLVDSIGKKISVVDHIVKETGLVNITTQQARLESLDEKYDFIVCRAVTALPVFLGWCRNKGIKGGFNALENGILYLKGGDIAGELSQVKRSWRIFDINAFFSEPYFQEKKIVFIPF